MSDGIEKKMRACLKCGKEFNTTAWVRLCTKCRVPEPSGAMEPRHFSDVLHASKTDRAIRPKGVVG